MRRKIPLVGLLSLVSGAGLLGGLALAGETITYGYDSLGRLTASSASGGPNSGVGTVTCFDAAGNRAQYQTGTSVVACTVPAPPNNPALPQPPAPPPAPPTPVNDTGQGTCNMSVYINVLANDTDPGGNTPLTLVSVTSTNNVSAVISGNQVQVTGYYAGVDTISYVVVNSKGVTGTANITYTTKPDKYNCTGGSQ